MSSAEGEKRERRRRPPRRRAPKKEGGEGEAKASTQAPRERRPRPENVPVPSEMVGTSSIGNITTVILKGRGQFGWISADGGNAEMPRDETPRVYFNFKDYTSEEYPPRKGLQVSFDIAKDAEDRVYALNVKLTAQGLKTANERKEAAKAQPPAGKFSFSLIIPFLFLFHFFLIIYNNVF